jgi:ribosome-binding protein aMBF1 (putative translation factor)
LSRGSVEPGTLAGTVSRSRLRLGLGVGDLAAKSGVPEHVVLGIESGDSYVPSEANTVKLAVTLRVPASVLLTQRELRARVIWQEH